MTIMLVFVTVIISIIALNNEQLMGKLIFNPYLVQHRKQWHRFITSGFIHADWMHLLINMFVLYSFGKVVELYYQAVFDDKGNYYFLLLYFGGILFSVTPTYGRHKNDPGYNALGASGAVSAIVFAAILFDPMSKIYLWGIIGFPGIVLGIVYLAYSWYMGKKGGDNINHDAHFWGAVFGVLFTVLLKPTLAMHFISRLTGFGSDM